MNTNGKRRSVRKAVAYLRTSSASNVGEDKDSHQRQAEAIETFARRHCFEVVASFYDAAVSGADHLSYRAGFSELLAFIEANSDVRTIVVETANRFARDLIVQETGFAMLRDMGVELVAADSPSSFLEDTPTARMVRQILGAVSEFEKASLVAKLKAARDRKKAVTGKCGGRRSHAELRPDVVALAKRLYRLNSKTRKRRSLRAIAAELAAAGHVNVNGRLFNQASVRSMLHG